jgi:Tfp pilus assembly protein PilF
VVALAALGCLVAIGIPLASSNELTASQQAASRGDLSLALRDAQEAARVEPGAASPRVQLALVEERQGNVRAALRSAEAAARDEPANWSTWLIISRLDAEAGKARASYAAFRRARALNPNSPLFLRGRHRVVRRG